MWGTHENEDYARCVAQGIEKLNLDGVVVERYKWDNRDFGKIMKETGTYWVLDLHSETGESMHVPDDDFLYSRLIGSLGWGWQHDYNKIMKDFFDKYYDGVDVTTYGPHAGLERLNMHAGWMMFALIWYRSYNKSLDLVNNLSEHLQGYDR
jgi:hypothetical protein